MCVQDGLRCIDVSFHWAIIVAWLRIVVSVSVSCSSSVVCAMASSILVESGRIVGCWPRLMFIICIGWRWS